MLIRTRRCRISLVGLLVSEERKKEKKWGRVGGDSHKNAVGAVALCANGLARPGADCQV